jgi:hypothetical protein
MAILDGWMNKDDRPIADRVLPSRAQDDWV